jgi:hypothetical protein
MITKSFVVTVRLSNYTSYRLTAELIKNSIKELEYDKHITGLHGDIIVEVMQIGEIKED